MRSTSLEKKQLEPWGPGCIGLSPGSHGDLAAVTGKGRPLILHHALDTLHSKAGPQEKIPGPSQPEENPDSTRAEILVTATTQRYMPLRLRFCLLTTFLIPSRTYTSHQLQLQGTVTWGLQPRELPGTDPISGRSPRKPERQWEKKQEHQHQTQPKSQLD